MRKAANSATMRQKNEKLILSLINQMPISRVEIARKTGLTKAAVSIITDDLLNREIIFEKEQINDKVGRNPFTLSINYNSVYIIGVNIERKKTTIGIANIGGETLAEEEIQTGTPEETLARIAEIIQSIIQKKKIDVSKIYKVSVAAPGPLDRERGKILAPPNFDEWRNFSLKEKLESALGYEVILDNVANAVALAEEYYGAAKNQENFLTFLVDRGIGTGLVIGGRLFRGLSELGHVSIMYNGKPCPCGNRGCLEQYASIPAVLEGTSYGTWEEVINNKDIDIIKEEANYIAAAIINANNIFDLDMAVICGDLIYKPNMLLMEIKEALEGRLIRKKHFSVKAGYIESKLLIATSIAANDFFGNK